MRLGLQTFLSVLVVAIGLALMTYKIRADSEPGAVPLVLVVAGVVWYAVARARARSRR